MGVNSRMKIMNVGDRIMNTWVYEGPDGYIMIDTGYCGKKHIKGEAPMVKSREKRKHRWWIPVIITAAVLVAALGIYKTKNSRTDATLILTISGQGFEGHYYDAGEREKAVITFSGSEGGSSASDTMAWYYKQHGISSLGVTLFAGKETGKIAAVGSEVQHQQGQREEVAKQI